MATVIHCFIVNNSCVDTCGSGAWRFTNSLDSTALHRGYLLINQA